ncbi:MAG TPA: hypothetical protein VML55_05180 [Planctomycetaceae bacterium]|nr:hypothetical protein [Planctomycetaceae bacterium]
MKANLKGLDFKQLLIAHGEKAGVAVVVLFSLFAVTGMTRWATYQEKTPEELVVKVQDETQNLQQSQWPDEERQQFLPRHDITQSATMMVAKVDVTDFKYQFGQKLIQSLYKYQEPMREPEWLKVEELIATPVRAPIQVTPTATEDAAPGDESAKPDEQLAANQSTDPRLVRRGVGGPGGGTGPGGTRGGSGPGAGGAGLGGIPLGGYNPDDAMEADPAMAGDEYSDYYGGGAGGAGGRSGPRTDIEVEGVRFVAVRGVFRIREQMQKIIDALGDPDAAARLGQDVVNILGFELERQTAQPGPDPWVGPWELITVDKAKEILSRAANWDQEVVVASITDPVITCPLPFRVMGRWGDEASHPRVEKFHLSPEGQEFQALLEEKLREWEEQQQQQQTQPTGQLQKGGFADIARDSRRTMNQFTGGGQANYTTNLSNMFGPRGAQNQTDPDTQARLKQQLEAAVNAGGHLLLFRFFDYTVEPGNLYRYRVRLVLENPNRNSSPDQAVDPSVVAGNERKTQWSNETPPVHVDDDAEYYLRLAKTASGPNPDQAKIDMYQWLPNIGTMTHGLIDVSVGQFVGGKTTTMVVVPEKEVDLKEVEFQTNDMLVDISSGSRTLDPGEHAALGLKRGGQLELTPQAIVVNEAGELVALNPRKDLPRKKVAADWVNSVRELYKDLMVKKDDPAAQGGGYDGDGGMDAGMMEDGAMEAYGGAAAGGGSPYAGGGQRRGGSARGSAIRKQGGGGRAGAPTRPGGR